MKRDLPAYCYRKGRKGYVYFCRHGATIRIHDAPGTPEFAVTYARLLRGQTAPARRSIRALIRQYLASKDFDDLKPNTKRSYRRHLTYLDETIGEIDPATLRPSHVEAMRQTLSDKPTDANRKVSVLSSLLQYGIRHDWLKENPAKEITLSHKHVKPHAVWPVNVVAAYREAAEGPALLLFELLIGTGQRIGDVLAMQWGHIEDNGIHVRQQKTGETRWIPFTSRLRATLAETPRYGLFIASQPNGRPMSYNLAWKLIADVRKTIDAMEYDIHGLRHTAASEIISAPGMTLEHVQAITGHRSAEMAQHYSLKAGQRARAEEAQKGRK